MSVLQGQWDDRWEGVANSTHWTSWHTEVRRRVGLMCRLTPDGSNPKQAKCYKCTAGSQLFGPGPNRLENVLK